MGGESRIRSLQTPFSSLCYCYFDFVFPNCINEGTMLKVDSGYPISPVSRLRSRQQGSTRVKRQWKDGLGMPGSLPARWRCIMCHVTQLEPQPPLHSVPANGKK